MIDIKNTSNIGQTSDPHEDWWNNAAVLKAEYDVYQTVRKQIPAWHPDIYKRISRAEMDSTGKIFCSLIGNTFCFDSEEHSAIFMDYLITFSCPNGTTAIERFLKSFNCHGADNTSRLARQALAGVRYTILRPVEARPEFGVLCEDMFLGGRIFLMDRGLSQTAPKDFAIATAVYPAHNWLMTSGAALPLPGKNIELTIADIFEASGLRFSQPVHLSKKDVSRLVLTMIRLFIMSDGLNHIEYR